MGQDEGGGTGAVDLPPYGIVEYLNVNGVSLLRVVATADDEAAAHDVVSALAAAGLKVWLLNLCAVDGSAHAERYSTPAMAVWANERGHDLLAAGGTAAAQLAGF